jgi:protein-S-isoprenylcysteine O-methyltransferase Ste14
MKVRINIALTLIVGLALGLFAYKNLPAKWTPLQTIGLLLMAVGFILWTLARFQLGNSLTVSAQAKQLVTHGLYSRVRNPIYVFGSTLIAGLILLMGRPVWLLVFAVIIPLQLWRAGKESQVLETEFGEAYRTYRASTWF